MISKEMAREIGTKLAKGVGLQLDDVFLLPENATYPDRYIVNCIDSEGEQYVGGTPGGLQKAIAASDGEVFEFYLPLPGMN